MFDLRLGKLVYVVNLSCVCNVACIYDVDGDEYAYTAVLTMTMMMHTVMHLIMTNIWQLAI